VPVRQSLHNLQRRGAFKAAFTSEKRWMTIKKKFIGNWQLGPNWPITVRDGAVALKGSHRMEDSSAADPEPNPDPTDPRVFGSPGSGSISKRYGSGSGSFRH
jgi:hypothetical protein